MEYYAIVRTVEMAYFSGIALDMLKIKAFAMEGQNSMMAEKGGFGVLHTTPVFKGLFETVIHFAPLHCPTKFSIFA